MNRKIPFLFSIIGVLLISGCTSNIDPADIAKATSSVKEFLNEYPNAKVTASYLDESYIENIIDDLRDDCGEQMMPGAYWKVLIKDPDSNSNVTVWVEEDSMKAVCVIREGEEGVQEYIGSVPTGFTTLGVPDDWDLDSNGDFSIILTNRLANQITVYNVSVSMGSDLSYNDTVLTIAPGGKYSYPTSLSGLNLGQKTLGTTYSISVEILYNSKGFNHTETGKITGIVSEFVDVEDSGGTGGTGAVIVGYCLGAEAIIQGTTYDDDTLNLFVNNRGDVDLTFDVLLTFDDGSIFRYKGYAADAGELATFTIGNVPNTLTEATIQGKECKSAQDFIERSRIRGLGFCSTDEDCQTMIACPLIVGGGMPKCNPDTNQCYCGGDFTQRQVQQTQYCLGAEAIIQGATYDAGTLNLFVNNRGDVDLTFDVILNFDDGSVTKPSGTFAADAGELATFSISGVSSNLTEATIQGKECKSAQDFVGRSWINGLPALGERIKIANWNLQIFGNKKASNDDLMQTYASIIDDYDIVFIQEIRNKDQTAFPKLCSLLPDYDCSASSRAGRTSSKEQYGVIYRKGIEIDNWKDFNPDSQDRWERPPIEVAFDIEGYELVVYNIHTKPDDAPSEIDYLEDVVKTDGNIIVLGDLNADCSYYNPSVEDDFDSWNWIVKDYEDTTVSSTNCAYDRIILNDDSLEEYVDYGIYTEGITEDVSDHYLVWVELEI